MLKADKRTKWWHIIRAVPVPWKPQVEHLWQTCSGNPKLQKLLHVYCPSADPILHWTDCLGDYCYFNWQESKPTEVNGWIIHCLYWHYHLQPTSNLNLHFHTFKACRSILEMQKRSSLRMFNQQHKNSYTTTQKKYPVTCLKSPQPDTQIQQHWCHYCFWYDVGIIIQYLLRVSQIRI